MTPVLLDRLQTRIFVTLFPGLLWTLIVTPVAALFVPGRPALADVYELTLKALVVVGVVGVLWEVVYHALQQFRWEKDWPALFGLFNGINEGLSTYLVLRANLGFAPPVVAFLVHFVSTYLVIWLWVNGPMRVMFIRWRFRGGRLL